MSEPIERSPTQRSGRELVLATRNEHKLKEFRGLLDGHEVLPLPESVVLPPETGDTFEANALGKARAACTALGMTAIADDSGIAALALDGAPGIYSARYAGLNATDEENLHKLIEELEPYPNKNVEYVCAIAYVEPGGHEELFVGRCGGWLTTDLQGDGGFGYDPAVIPDDYADGRTMAQLTQQEKDAISHRGRAAAKLLAWLDPR